jgi:indolepyruvate ferredoxin oxidoreductase
VARLSLDPAVAANVRSRFGAGARMSYRLHPPVLRALGARKKLTLGPWFRPVFGVLVRMRRLRGTRLDPFGYTSVRRTERELIAEYARLIGDLLATLSPGNHALAVQLASLPDEVRGYEQVKLDNVTRYRERLAELRTAYARQAEPVKDSRS